MKARLVEHNSNITLLKCNGEITHVSHIDARDFLLNFSDKKYHPENSSWDYDDLTMDNYRGTTVAFVDDKGDLIIKNAEIFKEIILKGELDFLSVPEFAELHGKSIAMVRRLCQKGRISGARLIGNVYVIPSNATYPK